MDRAGLFEALVAARLGEGDVVYVERRGDDYSLSVTGPGMELPVADPGAGFPDVWVYWSGRWPDDDDPDRQHLVFDDLLAEMESMGGGQPDRCRWSLEDPWPHMH